MCVCVCFNKRTSPLQLCTSQYLPRRTNNQGNELAKRKSNLLMLVTDRPILNRNCILMRAVWLSWEQKTEEPPSGNPQTWTIALPAMEGKKRCCSCLVVFPCSTLFIWHNVGSRNTWRYSWSKNRRHSNCCTGASNSLGCTSWMMTIYFCIYRRIIHIRWLITNV